jgi:hypothetical protein
MEGNILLLALVLAGVGLVDIIRYIYLTLSLVFSTKRELKDCQL